MKIILLSLLILGTLTDNVLLGVSGDSSTPTATGQLASSSLIPSPSRNLPLILKSDTSDPTSPPPNWNFLNQNSLGGNTVWITPVSGSKAIYDRYWLTNYTITFTTDCNRPVKFIVAATGYLRVFLNGTLIQDWLPSWPSIQ